MKEWEALQQLIDRLMVNRDLKEKFKHMKIVNRKEMRACVEQGVEFKGTNKINGAPQPTVWGEWRQYGPYTWGKPLERCFCVFSYSYARPIIVFSELTGKWYANQDKANPTTTRHMTECMPTNVVPDMMSRKAICEIVANGTAGSVRQMIGAA